MSTIKSFLCQNIILFCFDLKQTWVYLQEAIPVHHYQIQLTKKLQKSLIKEMLNYSGYGEGCAVYVE